MTSARCAPWSATAPCKSLSLSRHHLRFIVGYLDWLRIAFDDAGNRFVTAGWCTCRPSISCTSYWMKWRNWCPRSVCLTGISTTSARYDDYSRSLDGSLFEFYFIIVAHARIGPGGYRWIRTFTQRRAWIRSTCSDSSRRRWRITAMRSFVWTTKRRRWRSIKSLRKSIWPPTTWQWTCSTFTR